MANLIECISCHNLHQEEFCPHCGQRRFKLSDISIKEFLKHIVESFFGLDSRTWRTIFYLFVPGGLSVSFITGEKRKFLMPMQLFLLINVLFYFFFANSAIFFSRIEDMNDGYNEGISAKNYFHYNIVGAVNNKADKYVINVGDLNRKVELKANNISKALLFLIVPVWGLAIYFLFKKKNEYVLPGQLIALNGLSIYMLVAIAYIQPFFKFGDQKYVSDYELLPFHIAFSVYIFFSLYKMYKSTWVSLIWKSAVAIFSFFVIISIYKQFVTILALALYPVDYKNSSFLGTAHLCILLLLLGLLLLQFFLRLLKKKLNITSLLTQRLR